MYFLSLIFLWSAEDMIKKLGFFIGEESHCLIRLFNIISLHTLLLVIRGVN
jgi:hypothetical protein